MKILLIDIVRTSLDEVWPSVEHSLGLMYLAATARQRFGSSVEVRIWTQVSKPDSEATEQERVLEQLEEFVPDVVGIRALSIGKDALKSTARTVKTWGPDCVLLAGGPHATDAPEQVLDDTPVDCVAIGEGEETFVDILTALKTGGPLAGIPGTVTRTEDGVVRGPLRPLIAELDAIPRPDYSLIDLEAFNNRYLTFTSKITQKHGNLLTTRGCPYRCMYCHNILGKSFRCRSPESVIGEVLWLHETYGITDFQIVDDIFNLDKARAKAICDGIAGLGLDLTFSFPNGVRGDVMDEELLDKMARMGTKFMSYAIETASPRLQRLIRKNLRLERIARAIEYTTQIGIVTRGFFMLGFPTETYEEARMTVDFARDSSLCGATFFTVVYFPGTELYKLAVSLGYFKEGDAEVRRDYVQVAEGPYEFDVQTLTDLKRSAIQEFAFTQRRIEQASRLLPSYFTQREIDGFFMAYVVSSGMAASEVRDRVARDYLRRHFMVAERFSSQRQFYV